jgi:hypothetical protein
MKTKWAGRLSRGGLTASPPRKKIMIETSHIGLVSLERTSSRDYLEAGRIIERVWLKLTGMGVHVQPMYEVISFILLYKFKVGSFLSPTENRLLKDITEQFFDVFDLGFGKTPVFLFRMGFGNGAALTERMRKPLESFLHENAMRVLAHDQA